MKPILTDEARALKDCERIPEGSCAHHMIIDSDNVGRCMFCPRVIQYSFDWHGRGIVLVDGAGSARKLTKAKKMLYL